jgi:hypothetical protein
MVRTAPTGLYLTAQSTSAVLTPGLLLTLLSFTESEESLLKMKS